MPQSVLFLLRNYFTHDARVLKEAQTLTHAGYNVTIMCLWKNGLPKEEIINNIIVKRSVSIPQKSSKLQKIFAFIAFFMRPLLKARQYDIIHCHDLDTLPIGIFMKLLNPQVKVIYDAHEHETERAHIHGITKKIYRLVERFFIRFADSTITVSDSIANEYRDLYHITKPHLVLNCPPLKKRGNYNHFRYKFGIPQDQIIFLYQGGLMHHRGIEEIINTFKERKEIVVFMGYGILEDMIKEAAQNHPNIYYHEAVSPEVLLEYTASADIGLMLIDNISLSYYYCAPNKFFEYIMAGLPVIISDLYEMKKIISQYDNGLVRHHSLAEVLEQINPSQIERMKQGSIKAAHYYCWENQEQALLAAYQ
jgi:glycosyltransferase involved in cell wall biosynthesis